VALPRCVSPGHGAVGALLLAALLGAGCGAGQGSPEEALRAFVAHAEAAAEARDRRALMAMVSAAYADARGNDRAAIGRLVRLYFLRRQDVALLTHIDDIELGGDSAARVTVTVGMAGSGGGTSAWHADAYRLELELEADDGEWSLIGARWSELGGELR